MSITSNELLHPFNAPRVVDGKENSLIFDENALQNHKPQPQLQVDIKSENGIDDSSRLTSKRAPSTPLTPSLQQQNIVRRRIIHQSPVKSNSRSNTENIYTNTTIKHQLIDSRLESWQLTKQLTKSKDTIKFLQLEQEFCHIAD